MSRSFLDISTLDMLWSCINGKFKGCRSRLINIIQVSRHYLALNLGTKKLLVWFCLNVSEKRRRKQTILRYYNFSSTPATPQRIIFGSQRLMLYYLYLHWSDLLDLAEQFAQSFSPLAIIFYTLGPIMFMLVVLWSRVFDQDQLA